MKSGQHPFHPVPGQLSLLTVTTRPKLNADERREVTALLARLLLEASGEATPEVGNERG